ncbi:MAG TPA: single-stranded DNA-binding protein [Povalibacter sp.]|uniref:single-stranded DNA-binding protein n=1 Tax=Povalibacter sp. TaxID=1962978 RepID=UPI002CF48738|nr:single-stranded DNA-binding protein [Povalibacter sp.]HMN45891.1 single-stranded DNA-binding protein [Povalibacter sp.]
MIKVEVKDASVERVQVNGKNGSFTSERQVGWVTLSNGETRRIRLRVNQGKPYNVGTYMVGSESFTVSQYGDLQLGALQLVSCVADTVGAARKVG